MVEIIGPARKESLATRSAENISRFVSVVLDKPTKLVKTYLEPDIPTLVGAVMATYANIGRAVFDYSNSLTSEYFKKYELPLVAAKYAVPGFISGWLLVKSCEILLNRKNESENS